MIYPGKYFNELMVSATNHGLGLSELQVVVRENDKGNKMLLCTFKKGVNKEVEIKEEMHLTE